MHERGWHWILTISLVLMILGNAFSHYLFNQDYYEEQFDDLGVTDELGYDLSRAGMTVIHEYFRGQQELGWVKAFRQEEKEHLRDVKDLVSTGYLIYSICIMATIACLIRYLVKYRNENIEFKKVAERIVHALRKSTMILLIIGIVIAVMFLLGSFELFFRQFHKVFFPQGNWIFPDNYLLVNLFPKEFFYRISISIYIRMMTVAVIGHGISLVAYALGYDMRSTNRLRKSGAKTRRKK